MNIFQREIAPEEIRINPELIPILLGLDDNPLPEHFLNVTNKEISNINRYKDIRGGYIILEDIEVDAKNRIFCAGNQSFTPGKQVMKSIQNSEMLAFFVCTAGEAVSRRADELMKKNEWLECYVVDIIGTMIVESAMDIIQEELSSSMNIMGYKTTNSYSPGYCDWKVDEQHKLFRLLPDDFCGVRLSETAMMSPVKSISGVIGIGKNVEYEEYTCYACPRKDCVYRKVGK